MAGATILVLNGPNLNLLGVREPATYGRETLADIEEACLERAADLNLAVDFRQSNHEGQLVDWIQEARETADGIVINAAALTHYGWSLHDALAAFDGKVVEVHLSNPFAREPWRHTSVVTPVADGCISGFGGLGYDLAIEAVARMLDA